MRPDEQPTGDDALPLGHTHLDVPVPPHLAEACGYRGNARYVGFYWMPAGDEVVYDDGRSSGTGDAWAFLAYRRHGKVEAHLRPYNLGYSDLEAEHALIIDRANDLASVASMAIARQFLRAQHPPPVPLSPEQRAQLERTLEQLTQPGWREVKIDPQQIRRAMEQQRQHIARILAYLDQWPDL